MVVNRIQVEMIVVEVDEVVGVDGLEIVVVVVWAKDIGIEAVVVVVVLDVLRSARWWRSDRLWWRRKYSSITSILIDIPSWISSDNRFGWLIATLMGIIVFTLNAHFEGDCVLGEECFNFTLTIGTEIIRLTNSTLSVDGSL